MTAMNVLGRPLFEDKHVKEYLLLGEEELQRVMEQQKGGGKQGDEKERYRSANDATITRKTYMNSEEEEENYPLAKQLDKWKGMDRDHVLNAFREYVIMNRWLRDYLRKGSPLPDNLEFQDVVKYLRKIKKKYKTQFIELGLIAYKNVKPQTTPQFRAIGVGTTTTKPPTHSVGIGSTTSSSVAGPSHAHSSMSGSSTSTYGWDSEEEDWDELKKSVLSEIDEKKKKKKITWVKGEDDWGDVIENVNEFNKEQASEGKKKYLTEDDIANAGELWMSGQLPEPYDSDDSDDSEESPQKGKGRKRVLDEEDYYPFPVFNKKWVKVG